MTTAIQARLTDVTVTFRSVSGLSTTARLALYGKPMPRIEDAVKVGEWVRQAVMGKAKWLLGEQHIPKVLSGHDLPDGNKHGHAFYLPEDADGDGHIDHIVVYAPDGFDVQSRRVLDRLTRLNNRQGQEWQVLLENIAETEAFKDDSALIGKTKMWVSVTPYLHPWFAKKKFTVEDQLRRECRERGLPEIKALERLETIHIKDRSRRPIDFHRFRSKRGLTQPDTHGGFWRIEFAESVQGLLALGFGCHFGLGLFVPIRDA